jgi:hypothetical protein
MNGKWVTNIAFSDMEQMLKVLAANYPERLAALYLFRPPLAIDRFLESAGTVFGKQVLAKVVVE